MVDDRKMLSPSEEEGDEEMDPESTEKVFEGMDVPSWTEQLTVRAFVVSLILGSAFSVIVMKLNFSTGIIPSLNVSSGFLGFFFVKAWVKFISKAGQPFTRQENTVIQTCVAATAGIGFSGGFGSYLFAMSEIVAKQRDIFNDSNNVKNPHLGWMIGFMFVVSFLGLFCLVPLRKIMIIDYKLIYPSGTATALLINSFHTPKGSKLVRKQIGKLGKFFSISFAWSFFQWFFNAGEGCGFESFPTFGLKAYANKFYFDFSAMYVGVGMICPYLVNISLLVGSILSWGVMWPLISKKEGIWFPAGLPETDMQGLQGYKIFISIAMILGDGLYNFVKVLSRTIMSIVKQAGQNKSLPESITSSTNIITVDFDEKRRNEAFEKDQIPKSYALVGYIAIATISIGILPHMFPPLKRYHIVTGYIIAPVFAFCNAYGCGLTDWGMASTYGKLAIFTVGAWVGASHGGVLAGLASCGVMMNIVSTAADLMQDFKTGYLTLSSPKSMFISQIIGTAIGCVVSPCVFWLFYKAFPDIGTPHSAYPVPYSGIYRSMAIIGVNGLDSLPKHCVTICLVFFISAVVINLVRDLVGEKIAAFIPVPMAMAIPLYMGSYFTIDMCVGSLILFTWEKLNKTEADAFAPAVASGLICGDGIWSLPAAFLSLANIKPPICMKFLSRSDNLRVDSFLSGQS